MTELCRSGLFGHYSPPPRREAAAPLSWQESDVLAELGRRGGVSRSELARAAGLSRAHSIAALAALERRSLVRVVPSGHGRGQRRTPTYELTPAGRALANRHAHE